MPKVSPLNRKQYVRYIAEERYEEAEELTKKKKKAPKAGAAAAVFTVGMARKGVKQ